MRTTMIGVLVPTTGGVTPGMRRPVRTMTEPPIPSRNRRLGEPTPPISGGVTVAALSPSPASTMAAAATRTTSLLVFRRFSKDMS